MSDDINAVRVARNDSTFRAANERIEAAAEELEVDPVPFICECAEESCTAVIQLSLREYEQIRSESTHFLNAPGHEAAAGPHGQVVAEREGYVVVEKIGLAGDIVTRLDDRVQAGEERTA